MARELSVTVELRNCESVGECQISYQAAGDEKDRKEDQIGLATRLRDPERSMAREDLPQLVRAACRLEIPRRSNKQTNFGECDI